MGLRPAWEACRAVADGLFSRRNWLAWGVLLGSLGVVLLAWQTLRNNQHAAATAQFALLADELSQTLDERMTDHERILLAAAGLFDASQEVSRDDWKAFIQRLQLGERYPGIQGVGFAERVPGAERSRFEARVRAEGFADFSIRPPGAREPLSAIVYLEPFSGRNLAAFGFDMLTESTRRQAMLAAAESGATRLSGKVTLVQETHGKVQPGLLMYVPVYRSATPPKTPEERLQALRGLVYSPYRVHDMINGIFANRRLPVDFELFAEPSASAEQLLFSSLGEQPSPRAPLSQRQLHLHGQTWLLRFYAPAEFAASLSRSQLAQLLLGSLISLLLFFLVSSLSRRREQAQNLATRMTEQLRRQEQDLRLNEERLALAVKGSNDGWWDYDVRTASLLASPRAWQILDLPEHDSPVPLASLEPLLAADERQACLAHIRQAMAEQHTYLSIETRLLHRAGHAVPVLLRGYIQRDAQQQPQRISGTLMDISESKRIEQLKSDFVSTVSHELRTPLTSISGALGLISGGALGAVPERMAPLLRIALHNSQRLSLLIDDLLDIDKLLAGKMSFDLQAQPLLPLLQEALSSNQAYAEQYQVSYCLQPGSDPLACARVDARRLQQVLANLLSNACKFSPPGACVELSLERHGELLRVSVRDHGEGIPADFQARIFQKFSQADASSTRQKGGTGLGLAISKELIEHMHGQLGFVSQLGQGACFWFELPACAGPPV